jgi:hypothetical protein
MKHTVFWFVTPYSSKKVKRFREKEIDGKLISASCWFLAWFVFRPLIWRRFVPPKRREFFERHEVATQNLLTLCIYVLHTVLTVNSDCFPKQH